MRYLCLNTIKVNFNVYLVLATFLLLGSQCRKTVSYVYISEFEISNSTDTGITIISWLNKHVEKNFRIESKESFKFKEEMESPVTPAQFWNSDSLEIIFDNGKRLKYSWNIPSITSNNILSNDWETKKVADRHTMDSYVISNEHFTKAQ